MSKSRVYVARPLPSCAPHSSCQKHPAENCGIHKKPVDRASAYASSLEAWPPSVDSSAGPATGQNRLFLNLPSSTTAQWWRVPGGGTATAKVKCSRKEGRVETVKRAIGNAVHAISPCQNFAEETYLVRMVRMMAGGGGDRPPPGGRGRVGRPARTGDASARWTRQRRELGSPPRPPPTGVHSDETREWPTQAGSSVKRDACPAQRREQSAETFKPEPVPRRCPVPLDAPSTPSSSPPHRVTRQRV